MADVTSVVEKKIQSKKVMIFSKTTCPFREKVKKIFITLIENKDLSVEDYEVMEIDEHPNYSAFQDYLQEFTGARTVPWVFINGEYIGGGSEVVDLMNKDKLVPLLKS